MADPNYRGQMSYGAGTRASAADVDQGLRAHMLRVYNYMGLALALTGAVAWFTFSAAVAGFGPSGEPILTSFGVTLFTTPLFYVAAFSPLIFVLALSFGLNRMSTPVAQLVFWAYAAVMGIALSSILAAYTYESIARVFFITAAMFGGMSLWGYTTKSDLSGMGSFLMMGVIGLIVMMVVNIFMQSSMMSYVIGGIGVLIFTGLTAYDTQMIKNLYLSSSEDEDSLSKLAIHGALRLYLDFINLFLMLLRLFGGNRG